MSIRSLRGVMTIVTCDFSYRLAGSVIYPGEGADTCSVDFRTSSDARIVDDQVTRAGWLVKKERASDLEAYATAAAARDAGQLELGADIALAAFAPLPQEKQKEMHQDDAATADAAKRGKRGRMVTRHYCPMHKEMRESPRYGSGANITDPCLSNPDRPDRKNGRATHRCLAGELRCAFCMISLMPCPCSSCGKLLDAKAMYNIASNNRCCRACA